MNYDATTVYRGKRRDRIFSYLYLLNLIIPLSFLSLFPLRLILLGAALIVVFAGAYLATFRSKRWRISLIFLQILMMMALIGYLNGAYIWMVFYPLVCIAIFFEGRHVFFVVAGISILLIAENFVLSLFQPYALTEWLMILAAVVAGIAAFYGVIWQTQTIRSREQLHSAYLEIERLTKVAERERISRDLHDVMGQELSMITLKSQLANKLIDRDPERAKSEILDIEQAARQALTRVREYISGKRQPDIFAEWQDAIRLLVAAGVVCDDEWGLNSALVNVLISEASWQELAMCLREAITNLVRHSGATHCLLQLQQLDNLVCLKLCDNGHGIQSTTKSQSSGGNGIDGMRSRVASVGGLLTLWSNGELIGTANVSDASPSPWTTGVALLIEVPYQIPGGQGMEGYK